MEMKLSGNSVFMLFNFPDFPDKTLIFWLHFHCIQEEEDGS